MPLFHTDVVAKARADYGLAFASDYVLVKEIVRALKRGGVPREMAPGLLCLQLAVVEERRPERLSPTLRRSIDIERIARVLRDKYGTDRAEVDRSLDVYRAQMDHNDARRATAAATPKPGLGARLRTLFGRKRG
jgi:hypothetical protein